MFWSLHVHTSAGTHSKPCSGQLDCGCLIYSIKGTFVKGEPVFYVLDYHRVPCFNLKCALYLILLHCKVTTTEWTHTRMHTCAHCLDVS